MSDGLYLRGKIWWVTTDPITRKPVSTKCRDFENAKLWRSQRERMALTEMSYQDLWHSFYIYRGRGTVYFATNPDRSLVKIGHTTDVDRRFRQLNAGSPIRLECSIALRGTREHESACHHFFGALRTHGEWFANAGSLRRFLDEMALEPREAV